MYPFVSTEKNRNKISYCLSKISKIYWESIIISNRKRFAVCELEIINSLPTWTTVWVVEPREIVVGFSKLYNIYIYIYTYRYKNVVSM